MSDVEPGQAVSGPKKERSPSFPFIPLTKAIERVRAVHAVAKRHEARMPQVAEALGSGAKSSGTLQTVAALISFGLMEDSGSGDARKFRVTDLAFKALEDNRPGAKEAALREAALKPRLIAEYADAWRDGRPSDSICISELRVERGFTEDGAKAFLRVFDDAITYAKDADSDKKTDEGDATGSFVSMFGPDTDFQVGDLVQWQSGGVLRLERPKAIRAIHEREGRSWVFVEGSETGIPMEEITLERKAPPQPQAPPTLALPNTRLAQDEQAEGGMEVDRFTVDEGVVRIEFPKGMGSASVEELNEFFQLFIKKAKRRAGAH